MPFGEQWLEGSAGLGVALTVLSRDQPFLHKYKTDSEGVGSALQAPKSLNIIQIHGFRQEGMTQGLNLGTET